MDITKLKSRPGTKEERDSALLGADAVTTFIYHAIESLEPSDDPEKCTVVFSGFESEEEVSNFKAYISKAVGKLRSVNKSWAESKGVGATSYTYQQNGDGWEGILVRKK